MQYITTSPGVSVVGMLRCQMLPECSIYLLVCCSRKYCTKYAQQQHISNLFASHCVLTNMQKSKAPQQRQHNRNENRTASTKTQWYDINKNKNSNDVTATKTIMWQQQTHDNDNAVTIHKIIVAQIQWLFLAPNLCTTHLLSGSILCKLQSPVTTYQFIILQRPP